MREVRALQKDNSAGNLCAAGSAELVIIACVGRGKKRYRWSLWIIFSELKYALLLIAQGFLSRENLHGTVCDSSSSDSTQATCWV